MKGFALVCLFAFCAVAVARPGDDGEKYTDKYDNFDVKEVLNNDRLFNHYHECLMEKTKKCPPEAFELKSHITDALQTGCAKCTPIQRERVEEVMSHMVNFKVKQWEELCGKYDPEGKFAKKYEAELRKIKTP